MSEKMMDGTQHIIDNMDRARCVDLWTAYGSWLAFVTGLSEIGTRIAIEWSHRE